MVKVGKKSKVGRPKKTFTAAQIAEIDKMALCQCKDYAISEVIGVNVVTFKEHFLKRCKQKRAEGQAIKRQQQFDDKSPTMLIWWGKQYLEQSDKHEIEGKLEILPPVIR